MEAHDHRNSEGTDSQRKDFSANQVLDGVPPKSPPYTGEVDHGDRSCSSVLLRCGLHFSGGDPWNCCEKNGYVKHGDKLNDDSE
jgi:hypothetical protein